jgi:hypothetical protein
VIGTEERIKPEPLGGLSDSKKIRIVSSLLGSVKILSFI